MGRSPDPLKDFEEQLKDFPNVLVNLKAETEAQNSLLAFRKRFKLGLNDVECAPFHQEWSDILLHGDKHFAIEAFRESAKTQIVIRANLIHALGYPQPWRSYIVIICANQRTASKKLQEVSRELNALEWFKPNIKCMVQDSGEAIEVEYNDDGLGIGSAGNVRIEAYGKGAAVRGLSWGDKRPDLVVIDDPQDEEDARSDSVVEADWDWFLSDVLFLGQKSRIFLIGNNLGEKCIIEQVIKNADRLGFKTMRIPIIQVIKEKDEQGQEQEREVSAWPAKWPLEQIKREKEDFAQMNKLDVWYRNKMCECISPDSQKFREDMFREYNLSDLNLKELSVYTTADLAISLKPNADYTAVVTIGVSTEGHWFVLDVDYGRYTPIDTIDAIFHAVKTWHPLVVGIEGVAYQKALKYFLEREMPKRNVFFRIEPLHSEKKKELRIDTLQPRFAVGTVWFMKGAPWREKIENELLSYPHGAHDDVIDALAYMEQIAAPPMMGGFEDSGLRWEEVVGIAGKI